MVFVCWVAEWFKHSLPTLRTGIQVPSEAGSPGYQVVIGTGFILEIESWRISVTQIPLRCNVMQNECELAYQAIMNSAWYSPAP